QRRLDLATALVHDPRVLFLDEPTTGLDPVSRRAIWEEVRKLNDDGTTVFLTTQYLEEADQLADRVGIIDDGRMAAEGTPGALKAQIGRPHLEVTVADGTIARGEEILARFGQPMPAQNGALMVQLEHGVSGAIALAMDIEIGFVDRLVAAPIARASFVLGRLMATATLGLVSAVWFISIGLIFGAHVEGGVAGALVVIVLVVLNALAWGT